jgi:uncharacterized membrane protein YhiD involved in acid resistance
MNKVSVGVLATFVVILLGSGLLAYVYREQAPIRPAEATAEATPAAAQHNPLLGELFGGSSTGLAPSTMANWEATAARIAVRFSLAAFLAGLLAFRPRRGISSARRNPFVAQTQILMAVVAAAMMMVVGDSAARAFGIFAAASLVRFRTNIRDPKEITVLLICLAVGLASGVGRWDMALILTVFVFLTLAVLEFFEQAQVFRSVEMSVSTKKVEHTNQVLIQVFAEHGFEAELCELNREDEDDPLGKIVYLVDLKPDSRTSELSKEILAADSENIDTVEWKQKESKTYLYK